VSIGGSPAEQSKKVVQIHQAQVLVHEDSRRKTGKLKFAGATYGTNHIAMATVRDAEKKKTNKSNVECVLAHCTFKPRSFVPQMWIEKVSSNHEKRYRLI
jgi:hypothetical protein